MHRLPSPTPAAGITRAAVLKTLAGLVASGLLGLRASAASAAPTTPAASEAETPEPKSNPSIEHESDIRSVQFGRLQHDPSRPGAVAVIDLLDAESFFETTVAYAGAIEKSRLFTGGVAGDFSSFVVAGAETASDARKREYVLTPTASAIDRRGEPLPDGKRAGGGAPEMLDFLTGPWRRETERLSGRETARRVLAGHSYAGLFTLYALFARPDAWDDYIAIDPSLWWDGGRWADAFRETRPNQWAGKRVYLAYAERPRRGAEGALDRSGPAKARIAEVLRRGGAEVIVRRFPDEVHGTVFWPAMYDAMKNFWLRMP